MARYFSPKMAPHYARDESSLMSVGGTIRTLTLMLNGMMTLTRMRTAQSRTTVTQMRMTSINISNRSFDVLLCD
jgi:hypothetical protein